MLPMTKRNRVIRMRILVARMDAAVERYGLYAGMVDSPQIKRSRTRALREIREAARSIEYTTKRPSK